MGCLMLTREEEERRRGTHTNSRLLSDASKLCLITENREILTWIDKIFQFKLR